MLPLPTWLLGHRSPVVAASWPHPRACSPLSSWHRQAPPPGRPKAGSAGRAVQRGCSGRGRRVRQRRAAWTRWRCVGAIGEAEPWRLPCRLGGGLRPKALASAEARVRQPRRHRQSTARRQIVLPEGAARCSSKRNSPWGSSRASSDAAPVGTALSKASPSPSVRSPSARPCGRRGLFRPTAGPAAGRGRRRRGRSRRAPAWR